MLPFMLLAVATLATPLARPVSPDSLVPVTINLRGVVGADAFQCGRSYRNIGTTQATITVSDFRFYVHNVRLVNAAGDTVRAPLAKQAPWQDGDVALVDFEDGTGTCANGTPETRTEVTVLAPAGTYRGVAMTLGVPFSRNHGDLASQAPPLSLSRLFWSWNGGYKFLRLDMRVTQGDSAATGWVVHLGSTGCTGEAGAKAPTSCAQPNRAEVRLPGFDPAVDVIEADVAALLARSNVRMNQPQTAMGCMSAPNDADCGGLFASLGLAHPSGTGPDTPAFFRAAKAGAVRAAQGDSR
jgi:uncharacterized repeat protein (TIGR04052 family)